MSSSGFFNPFIFVLLIGSVAILIAYFVRLFFLRIILRKAEAENSPDIRWIILSLFPVIAWPMIFYASIFLFDDPSGEDQAYKLFFLFNTYPLLIIVISIVGEYLYPKYKRTAVSIFTLPTIFLIIGFTFILLNYS